MYCVKCLLITRFLHDSHSPIITVRTFVPRVCQTFAEFDIFLGVRYAFVLRLLQVIFVLDIDGRTFVI